MERGNMRHGREWSGGTFTGWEKDFLELPLEEQVLQLGWSHACPVVEDVIQTYGKSWAETHPIALPSKIREHGLLMTRSRYAECNFVFGLIVESARNSKPELFEQLEKTTERLPGEPFGIPNSIFAPESAKKQMAPLSTPWGYALPRVVIEQMGRGENNKFRKPERMLKALDMIDTAVQKSKNPIELAVNLAEMSALEDGNPMAILSHLLSPGILKEENCKTMFKEVIKTMYENGKTLSKAYNSLTPDDFEKFDIVSPNKLK
jgi:hypothetical protein